MTIEELSENMRFTDNEVIFDKQFYNDVMLKCFINSLLYKKLCQELKNENQKYKETADKAIHLLEQFDAWLEPQDFLKIKKIEEVLKEVE